MEEQQQDNAHHLIERTHSAFGDNYSVKSRENAGGGHKNKYVSGGGFGGSSILAKVLVECPEADYDDGATSLYRFIENKDWDRALTRIETHPRDCRTWVSRREYSANGGANKVGNDKTRWRLLPIHAVCIFRAPLALIEALLEAFPEGAQMKDDQGMLPVHLACRYVVALCVAFCEQQAQLENQSLISLPPSLFLCCVATALARASS